jgi:hypothetical protein
VRRDVVRVSVARPAINCRAIQLKSPEGDSFRSVAEDGIPLSVRYGRNQRYRSWKHHRMHRLSPELGPGGDPALPRSGTRGAGGGVGGDGPGVIRREGLDPAGLPCHR